MIAAKRFYYSCGHLNIPCTLTECRMSTLGSCTCSLGECGCWPPNARPAMCPIAMSPTTTVNKDPHTGLILTHCVSMVPFVKWLGTAGCSLFLLSFLKWASSNLVSLALCQVWGYEKREVTKKNITQICSQMSYSIHTNMLLIALLY